MAPPKGVLAFAVQICCRCEHSSGKQQEPLDADLEVDDAKAILERLDLVRAHEYDMLDRKRNQQLHESGPTSNIRER